MKSNRGTSASLGVPLSGNGMSSPAFGLKNSAPTEVTSPALEVKRRSERVKREKPNFYDALEYDNQMRKARKERQKEDNQTTGRIRRERKIKPNSEPDEDEEEEAMREKKKRKKKKNNNEKKEEANVSDEDIMAGISPEKEKQFTIVLSDINFKLGLNNPRFIKI